MIRQLALAVLTATLSCAPAGCASTSGSAAVDGPAPASRARAAGVLYVANQEAGAVSAIHLEDGSVRVIRMEELGFGANSKPHHVVVEPDGSFWYVSLIGANRVLKFDANDELVGSTEFERPGMLALHPTEDWLFVGRSMAAVNPPQRIGRIERSTMEVEEFEVFIPRPHALAVSPDGGRVYTASLAENTIVAVDAESGEAELTRLPDSGQHPHTFVHFTISPDGGTLAVTAEMTNQLLVFDLAEPARPRLVSTLDVAARPWHPEFAPDGRTVWFGNLGADAVTVVETASWSVAAEITGAGLAQPHGIAISADGSRVYIASRNERGTFAARQTFGYEAPDGTVTVIDAASRQILEVIEVPPYAAGLGLAHPR